MKYKVGSKIYWRYPGIKNNDIPAIVLSYTTKTGLKPYIVGLLNQILPDEDDGATNWYTFCNKVNKRDTNIEYSVNSISSSEYCKHTIYRISYVEEQDILPFGFKNKILVNFGLQYK